jgi:hypothetical protein
MFVTYTTGIGLQRLRSGNCSRLKLPGERRIYIECICDRSGRNKFLRGKTNGESKHCSEVRAD